MWMDKTELERRLDLIDSSQDMIQAQLSALAVALGELDLKIDAIIGIVTEPPKRKGKVTYPPKRGGPDVDDRFQP